MTNKEEKLPVNLREKKEKEEIEEGETNDNRKQEHQQVSSSIQQQQVTIGTGKTGHQVKADYVSGQQKQKPQRSPSIIAAAPPPPLRQQAVRPARPNHFRGHQVILAAADGAGNVVRPQKLIRQPIELASLGGHPLPVTVAGPPKRPAHLPARYDTLTRIVPPPPSSQAAAAAGVANGKPNRYSSWAHVQSNWRAVATAATPGGVRARGAAVPVAVDGSYGPHHHHHHFSSPFSSAASRILVVNPMQIVNLSEHTKSRLVKIIEATKRFSEKWFSHVLLLMFLALYACFGAYIFINFEAPTEQWEKQMIIDTRQRLVNESWTEAKSRNQLEFLDLFRVKLEDYERLLNRACASGMTSSSLENQWTFWGALFYSMTVFTTIGYGHLTPITFAGRVATMIYAIFGIPILLMVLADLGKLLTRIIKYAFKQFRSLYNQLLHRKTSIKTRKIISDNTNHCIGAARGAFERGYAHIQPYNRLPNALARASSFGRRKFRRNERSGGPAGSELEEAAAAAAAAAVSEKEGGAIQQGDTTTTTTTTTDTLDHPNHHPDETVAAPDDLDHHNHQLTKQRPPETTDVIVTPAKQTKPVSPPVKDRRQSPFESSTPHQRSHHSTHHNQNHNQHHHNQHHHHHSGRSQSPGHQQASSFTGRRKGSLGGGASNTSSGGQRKTVAAPVARGQVSRSSSLTSSVAMHNSNCGDSRLKSAPVAACDSPSPLDTTSVDHCDRVGKLETLGHLDPTERTMAPSNVQAPNVYDDDDDEVVMDIGGIAAEDLEALGEEEEEEEIEDEFDIPVSFALFLLVTYMMFGAVVFSIWEGWNFFDALYFVFISMSTIGFGDLVPQHPKRMIGTFIYLLFGLALTSMCINVVQEKIHATFLRAKMQIGEKMGLDLDQIMADDYYDGSTLECDEDDLNSVAASQTNSTSLACHMSGGGGGGGGLDGCDPMDPDNVNTKHLPVEGHGGGGTDGVKQSRSKDSIRSKRRIVSGLPGHNNGGSGSGGVGSTLRRSHSKKLQRQATPSSLQGVPTTSCSDTHNTNNQSNRHHSHSHPQSPVACCSVATTIVANSPSKPVEMGGHRMMQSVSIDTSAPPPPAINQPVGQVARGTCEPLQRRPTNAVNHIAATAYENNSRSKLMVSNSQPPSGTTSGYGRIPKSLSSETGFEIVSGKPRDTLATSGRYGAGPEVGRRNRSAESSRRSSVSHELNELDDLILNLSHCHADERFGPLLGIPSKGRRHSRPNSATPYDVKNRQANNNQATMTMTAKRGTSMINRPPSSSPSASQFQASISTSPSLYAKARSPSLVGRDPPAGGGGGGGIGGGKLPGSSNLNPAYSHHRRQKVNLDGDDEFETIKLSAV